MLTAMDASSLTAKKSLGQHFLTSPIVPNWMCDAAALQPEDMVIEIGPGTGVLTKELLARGAQVVALETDPRAITILQDNFAAAIHAGQLHLHKADVRTGELSDYLPTPATEYKVVSNIPYYLSGLLFRTVLTATHQPQTVVFLVQKEVAKRAHYNPHTDQKQSLLSLSIQVYGQTRYIKTVTRGHFTPPPNVDSAIIAIDHISRDFFHDCDEELFFKTLRLGFGNKRKQLLHNLATVYSREVATSALESVDVPLTVRAEDMTATKWKALVQVLSTDNPQ